MNTELLYTEVVHVSRKDRLLASSNSNRGFQIKWKVDNRYIKLDMYGYRSLAEKLVTQLLLTSNIPKDLFVKYYTCLIYEDGKCLGRGCYSYDFIKDGYEVTFRHIMQKNGLSMSATYEEVRDLMLDVTNIDVKDYIDRCLYLDSITRNDDRHFGNLGFIKMVVLITLYQYLIMAVHVCLIYYPILLKKSLTKTLTQYMLNHSIQTLNIR